MTQPINRRLFLRSAGAALAGSTLAPGLLDGAAAAQTDSQAGPQPGPLAGKVKKAVKYHMVQINGSVMDKFKLLADLGFDGVEPRVRDAIDVGPDKMAKASEATGVEIHGATNGSSPDLKKAIDVVREMGGSSVLTVVPTARHGSYQKNYEQRQQIIRDAIPHAEKHHIKILVENVWGTFLIAPPLMARFIDELDSEMVGSYFDVGNVMRWGHPHHWVEVLGRRIQKVDIKDYDKSIAMKKGMRAGFVPIGDGNADWPKLRKQLGELNYTSWATAERYGGDRKVLKDVARRMDKVLGL